MFDPNSILAGPRFRQDRLTLEAAWRFQLVAPLMTVSLSKLQRQHIRARILAEEHRHPWRGLVRVAERSLRRWCAQYRRVRLNKRHQSPIGFCANAVPARL